MYLLRTESCLSEAFHVGHGLDIGKLDPGSFWNSKSVLVLPRNLITLSADVS